MNYEELMKLIDDLRKQKEAYRRGEVKDDWSEECRKDWMEKCNA